MVTNYLRVFLLLLIYLGDTTPATVGFFPWWPSTLLVFQTLSVCCLLLASCPPVPDTPAWWGKRLSHPDTWSWHLLPTTSFPRSQQPRAWLCGNVSGQMCASKKSQRGWGCRKWKILEKLMSCCYKWVTKGGFHRVGSVFLWELFEV